MECFVLSLFSCCDFSVTAVLSWLSFHDRPRHGCLVDAVLSIQYCCGEFSWLYCHGSPFIEVVLCIRSGFGPDPDPTSQPRLDRIRIKIILSKI